MLIGWRRTRGRRWRRQQSGWWVVHAWKVGANELVVHTRGWLRGTHALMGSCPFARSISTVFQRLITGRISLRSIAPSAT